MRWLLLAGQVVGAALVLAGLYLLLGVEWAVILAGLGLLAVSTLAELTRRPPVRRED